MKIVECSLVGHGGQILEIINEVILNSTAVYDYEARAASSMDGWFVELPRFGGHPETRNSVRRE